MGKEIVVKGELIIEMQANGKDFNVWFRNAETGLHTTLGTFYHNFKPKFYPSTRLEGADRLLREVAKNQCYGYIPDLTILEERQDLNK